jgi:hypothetical protein
MMRASRAQLPSVAFRALTGETDVGEELQRSTVRQLTPDTAIQQDTGIAL